MVPGALAVMSGIGPGRTGPGVGFDARHLGSDIGNALPEYIECTSGNDPAFIVDQGLAGVERHGAGGEDLLVQAKMVFAVFWWCTVAVGWGGIKRSDCSC
jgi:hypothetical protein